MKPIVTAAEKDALWRNILAEQRLTPEQEPNLRARKLWNRVLRANLEFTLALRTLGGPPRSQEEADRILAEALADYRTPKPLRAAAKSFKAAFTDYQREKRRSGGAR